MDKRTHGPAFVRSLVPLTECPSCVGKGIIQGVFHQFDCIGCHASGLVHAITLEPLLVEELVVQLGMLLRRERHLATMAPAANDIAEQYQQCNSRGAGRSSFKGD
ncbi:DnaJ type IV chaperone protein [Pseudomonas sp. IT-P74]